MSERILTLFGEEIVPEQPKPVPKSRAKKKPEDEKTEEQSIEEKAAEEIADVSAVAEQQEEIQPAASVEAPIEVVVTSDLVVTEPERTDAVEVPEIIVAEEKPQEIEEAALPIAELSEEEKNEDAPEAETPKPERKKKRDDKTEEETAIQEKPFELPEDWKGDKQYYTIGEVAKLFNVKTSHIRFWTNEFKLKVRTTRKGDRLYTPTQVRELRAIHHLVKERGFTLNGAKTKLKTQNKRDVETIDLKQSLKELRNKLVIIREKLN